MGLLEHQLWSYRNVPGCEPVEAAAGMQWLWQLGIRQCAVLLQSIAVMQNCFNIYTVLQVDERLGGEGTGKSLGVSGIEGWAVVIVFGLVWAAYYQATKELGGDAGDDSGLSL